MKVDETRRAATRNPASPSYFFLSYAHSAPGPATRFSDADRWVKTLFNDLAQAVNAAAPVGDRLARGFFDGLLPPGVDWKAALGEALGAAEVIVPLFSPRYLRTSWSMSELASFKQRLAQQQRVGKVTASQAGRHVVSVLWTPLPSWDRPADLAEALDLGDGVPEYVENGLRALCMLAPYRDQYHVIVRRVAKRIVTAARESPLGPSHAPALGDVSRSDATGTQFVVGVIAPTRRRLPPGRSGATYGDRSEHWRPFADRQLLPAARYVENAAERLGLPTKLIGIDTDPVLFGTRPGAVLIDPWIIADPGGESLIERVISKWPRWITPVVVVDVDDREYESQGARYDKVLSTMLSRAKTPRVERMVDVGGFEREMPMVIIKAQRRYLRTAPVFPPKGPRSERPRLAGPRPSKPVKERDD
jgi:FxsC-like protein